MERFDWSEFFAVLAVTYGMHGTTNIIYIIIYILLYIYMKIISRFSWILTCDRKIMIYYITTPRINQSLF